MAGKVDSGEFKSRTRSVATAMLALLIAMTIPATILAQDSNSGLEDRVAELESANIMLLAELSRLSDLLAAEVSQRQSADAALQQATTTLRTELRRLSYSLSGEMRRRQSADAALQQAIDAEVSARTADDAGLEADVANLMTTFLGVSRIGSTLLFEGVNVQIVNGTGTTHGKVNGLGNLIVGYNEPVNPSYFPSPAQVVSFKSGSHNLVVGPGHNYSSYGGFLAGAQNAVTHAHASVMGFANAATGFGSSVSGGSYNNASEVYAVVSGGFGNSASADYAVVSGGYYNQASGYTSVVSGGAYNHATRFNSVVSGGHNNDASGERSVVSGGSGNEASGDSAVVSGGMSNEASGYLSVVSGGVYVNATGTQHLP